MRLRDRVSVLRCSKEYNKISSTILQFNNLQAKTISHITSTTFPHKRVVRCTITPIRTDATPARTRHNNPLYVSAPYTPRAALKTPNSTQQRRDLHFLTRAAKNVPFPFLPICQFATYEFAQPFPTPRLARRSPGPFHTAAFHLFLVTTPQLQSINLNRPCHSSFRWWKKATLRLTMTKFNESPAMGLRERG